MPHPSQMLSLSSPGLTSTETWAFLSPEEARQGPKCSVAATMRHLEVSGLGRGLRRSGIAAHCHVHRMAAAAAPVCRHPASHKWF